MKVLIAPDKFKGTLTADEVCRAVEEGLQATHPDAQITKAPLADGGEGTFELLSRIKSCSVLKVDVYDPLMRPMRAAYGITPDRKTAFIEMASASGLLLLKDHERNPLLTTSFGTGQLIADALNQGVEKIVLGIGGTATNDAGIGMASALGIEFQSSERKSLPPVGKSLKNISFIDTSRKHPRLADVQFTILCDVANPLYGRNGAAHVYGPQKGATPEAVEELDNGLKHYAELARKEFHVDLNFEGAGAAGGLGASARLFFHVNFTRGIQFIAELLNLEEKIQHADLVITGEGKIDEQTFSGKVASYVLSLAQKHKKPTVAICGQTFLSNAELKDRGFHEVIRLASTVDETERALNNAFEMLKQKVGKLNLR